MVFRLVIWAALIGIVWPFSADLPWEQLSPLKPSFFGIPTLAWAMAVVASPLVWWPLCLRVVWVLGGGDKPKPVAKGMTAQLGGMKWSRNAFCRGWLITGATGTGKTAVAINTLMHSVFRHESGKLRKTWIGSEAEQAFAEAEAKYYDLTRPMYERLDVLRKERSMAESTVVDLQNKVEAARIRKDLGGSTDGLGAVELELLEAEERLAKVREDWEMQTDRILRARLDFTQAYNRIRHLKYETYPWGGITMDQKGLFWQTLMGMARHHNREHDLYLLQTRPEWAGETWQPPARFNVLSDYSIPSNTYAAAIVKTATALAGGDGDKGFFKTKSESSIGWAIELHRQIRYAQMEAKVPESEWVYPSLTNVLGVLTNQKAFDQLLIDTHVEAPKSKARGGSRRALRSSIDENVGGPPRGSAGVEHDQSNEPSTIPVGPKLNRAIAYMRDEYWSQPPDQLGGVVGTISNYIGYFQSEDVAEVFCRDNTFNMEDLDKGTIVCVSMPQKLAIERRYVCTLLKILFFQHAQRRFDLLEDDLKKKNLIVCWQDEAQRFVIDEDKDVDTLREAMATTILATQGQPSLFPPLGGKEKAKTILLNLRNRIVLRSADDECAQATSEFLGKVEKKKTSYSYSKGKGGKSRSVSTEEGFIIPPHELRAMKDFTAIVCHSEGDFKKFVIMPRTVNDRMTKWWPAAVRKVLPTEAWRIKLGFPGRQFIKRPIKGLKSVKKS